MSDLLAAIAVTRFGMGARAGEITAAKTDPRGWLSQQIAPEAAVFYPDALLSATQMAEEMTQNHHKLRPLRRSGKTEQVQALRKSIRQAGRLQYQGSVLARINFSTATEAGFAERWARFWSNHFTVAARKPDMLGLVGAYEREAIRPNIFGRFADLLDAAIFHQGMLVYLDNHVSVGPNARARGRGRNKRGLNENLAREILELHTLGVEGGYTQTDVTSLAKALTGWSIRNPRIHSDRFGEVGFEPRMHEPGPQSVLGKRYSEGGGEQAQAIVEDLALHPATARHIAIKLARHFVSDTPPETAIETLNQTFLQTGGDLRELARTVINLDAAWAPEQSKLKTPEDMLVSASRALGRNATYGRDGRKVYESLGQPPFGAPSPDGWPDTVADWSGPDAIKKRLEWANRAAQRARAMQDTDAFLDLALGSLASDRTRLAVSRAESREQGLTLALMSPEFQRR